MRRTAASAAILLLGLSACGGSSSSPTATPETTTTAPATTAAVTSAASTATTRAPAVEAIPAPMDAGELEEIALRLLEVLDGHAAAWKSGDPDAVRGYWGDGTIHEDTGFGVLLAGDELLEMPESFFREFPDFDWEVTEAFISADVVLDVSEAWGVGLRGVEFSPDDPMLEIDRTEIEEDGTIGRWTLYYGLNTWESWGGNPSRMEAARALIEAYRAAWETGDPTVVAALYSDDAVRTDGLFGLDASGPAEIADFAARFAEANPGAAFTAGVGFSDTRRTARDREQVGSTFEIEVPTVGGESCTVRMAVILTADGGSIVAEEVFWEPESLLACGWSD
jgi:hypothetical protein